MFEKLIILDGFLFKFIQSIVSRFEKRGVVLVFMINIFFLAQIIALIVYIYISYRYFQHTFLTVLDTAPALLIWYYWIKIVKKSAKLPFNVEMGRYISLVFSIIPAAYFIYVAILSWIFKHEIFTQRVTKDMVYALVWILSTITMYLLSCHSILDNQNTPKKLPEHKAD